MTTIDRALRTLSTTLTLTMIAITASAQEAESTLNVTGRYTAQRRPRVTVLDFADTNAAAKSESYGASVQAMLVTFFKRKSQFVVVERQKLGDVLAEWRRNQQGLTNLQIDDPNAQQLLEKLDAIVLGDVTLLNQTVEANIARTAENGNQQTVRGPKIEIDAKLLSRADGRIIAAAQRSGPVGCLRSIVERLGIALEQEFLRPYYGKLKINLTDPEYVRVFLTPILLDTALDEEKPPVERSATVIMGSDRDIVAPWTTDPTTYTIENLLSGWYSMRLERPGYEGLGSENARWEARSFGGEISVYDRVSGRELDRIASELSRFVVHVDPLRREAIDGDALKLTFRKKGGSIAPLVKRQYLDDDYLHKPKRVVLIGGSNLEINSYERLKEYADDEACDLFLEQAPQPADYGTTYVASGQTFDFETFKGGELIIEDYRDEPLPSGEFRMTLWEPEYDLLTTDVVVRDRDKAKATRGALTRKTESLTLSTTGAKPPHKLILQGVATHHRLELPLDFDRGQVQNGLPVDTYVASTTVSGLGGWEARAELRPKDVAPPIFDPDSESDPPLKSSAQGSQETVLPANLKVKTRLCLGGRLPALSSQPKPADDIYVDYALTLILDALLQRPKNEENASVWQETLIDIGRATLLGLGRAALEAVVPLPQDTSAMAKEPIDNTTAAEPGTEIQEVPPPEPLLKPDPLPSDPEVLRMLFAERLQGIDLLVLDDIDMARLRQMPEVAEIIANWVNSGGALLAFVSEAGDYGPILGASLVAQVKGKPTDRFELQAGEISGFALKDKTKKKIQVKEKRALPEVKKLGWRVLAYGRGRNDPRILERGLRDRGGYVAVWCDSPESFRGRRGGMVPEVEAVRAEVEQRVLDWARYLMYRRYDSAGTERQRVEQTLSR